MPDTRTLCLEQNGKIKDRHRLIISISKWNQITWFENWKYLFIAFGISGYWINKSIVWDSIRRFESCDGRWPKAKQETRNWRNSWRYLNGIARCYGAPYFNVKYDDGAATRQHHTVIDFDISCEAQLYGYSLYCLFFCILSCRINGH